MAERKQKIPAQCGYCNYKWGTVRRGSAYCPKCGRVVKVSTEQDEVELDKKIERLWDAARGVLYHDVPAGEEAYQYNKRVLCEEWREILSA